MALQFTQCVNKEQQMNGFIETENDYWQKELQIVLIRFRIPCTPRVFQRFGNQQRYQNSDNIHENVRADRLENLSFLIRLSDEFYRKL